MNLRIKKLQQSIARPLLITNPQDLFYLTGRVFSDGGFLLVTKKDVVMLGGYLEDLGKMKTDSFRNLPKYLGKSKVLELDDQTSLKYSQKIQGFAPKIKIKPVSSPVKKLRLIKVSDELGKMKQAYQITAQVFGEVKIALKKKAYTEQELARFIRLVGIGLGADDISFPVIVAGGINAAVPHHVPTDKPLKAGESIVLDFGFKVDGYCSDFTRTVFIKKVPEDLERMYLAAEKAYRLGVAAVKNNVSAHKVDAAARDHLSKAGYGESFIHSLGHGTGLEVHESPSLSPQSKDILKTGMVFSIEPGIYIPQVGGIRIEDLVYLKDNKANYFTKVSTKLTDCIIK